MKNIFLIFLFAPIFSSNYLNIIGYDLNNKIDTKLLYLRKNQLNSELKNLESSLNNLIEKNDQKFFIILIASYNNIEYYEKNIKSVLDQDYQNYIAIYMDDISIDGTADAVEKYLEKHDIDNHFILIKNNVKKYCLKNYIDAINSFCLNNTILVTLDGDDWFSRNDVLEVLNNIYNDGKTWITTGDPLLSSRNTKFSDSFGFDNYWQNPRQKYFFNEGIRKFRFWYFFHLRSFYTALFLKINNEDLLDNNREYFKHTEDVSFMLPMLEMAGLEHYNFINKPSLYVYNDQNMLSTGKVWENKKLSLTFDFIFSKKAYSKLDKLEALD